MARRRGRKVFGILERVLTSKWPASAVLVPLTAAIGFGLLRAGPFRGVMVAPPIAQLRSVAGLLCLFVSVTALVKYGLARRAASRQRITDQLDQAEATRFVRNALALVPVPASSQPPSSSAPLRIHARTDKPAAWSLELIRSIEWKRFGELCAQFYREQGIRCEATSLGTNGGVDIRLFQGAVKSDAYNGDLATAAGGAVAVGADGRTTAIVQCKGWGERLVGVGSMRELVAVMTQEKIPKAFFMTNGSFTADAREFARTHRITLLDGKLFLAMVGRLSKDAQQRLLAFTTVGDYTTPSCAHCGVKMVAREGTHGKFWGCVAFPKCRQSLPMRKDEMAPSADAQMQGLHPSAIFSPSSALQLGNGTIDTQQEPGAFLLPSVTESRRLPTRPPLS